MTRPMLRLVPLALVLALGACADTPSFLPTASVTAPAEEPAATRAAKVDAACVTLAGQIDALRKEGTIERLEKVASGKGDNVQVKRTALAKQTELNKANADFQAKCGPKIPASTQAAAPVPAAPAAKVAAAAKSAAPAAVASGVTVAPSATPPKAPVKQ